MKLRKNKYRLLAVCISLMLVAGSAGVAYGEEATGGSSVSAENTGGASVSKDETVYVIAGQDGTAEHVIVSDWLKNSDKLNMIDDYTELKNVENVKGDESFDQKNGTGRWNAGGNDIYYQGETDKELPVTMKISYSLNGAAISPEKLAGKSGDVTIRFDYKNNQKIDGVYVPFVILTSMTLSDDVFSNVEVTNGKVINDGEKSIVVGYALPGLEESLSLGGSGVDIPDYVEVKCKAEDFELGGTMSVATSSLLDDLDVGSINSLDDLESALDQLESAASQLQDGSVALQEGAAEVASGTEELYGGTASLKANIAVLGDGLKSAKAGADQLKSGAGELQAGLEQAASQVSDAVNSAAGGLNNTITGDKKVMAGLEQLESQLIYLRDSGGLNDDQQKAVSEAVATLGSLEDGLDKTIGGQELILKGLTSGDSNLNNGMARLIAGAGSLSDGAGQLSDGVTNACEGAGLLEDGAGQLENGAKQLKDGTSALSSGSKDLAAGIAEFKRDGIDKLAEAFDGNISEITGRLRSLQSAAENYQSFAGKKAGTKGSVKFIYKTKEI